MRPARGARLPARLRLEAHAGDDSGIDRVEFWLDAGRLGSVRTPPFARERRRPARLRRGPATVTARAFAVDGGAASDSVTVELRASRLRRRGAWRIATVPDPAGTLLRGQGPARRPVLVTLTPCTDGSGTIAARVRLRAGAGGNVRATLPRSGLCVLGTRALRR
jgi:hypothetical protein